MPGRHRIERNLRTIGIAAAAALSVVATGAWAGGRLFTGERCDGDIRLSVAAAPEIAPAIRTVATTWAGSTDVDGKCVTVEVAARGSADVAAAVADQQGAGLVGLGKASGSVRVPHVWVPDSSLWRQRLQAAAPGFRPSDATAIATSPVVLAMPQPVASSLTKGGPLTWDALVGRLRAGTPLNIGVVDPPRDTAGLSGLLAFAQAAAKLGPQAQPATVAGLRALAKGTSAVRDDLLSRFPDATDADTVARSLGAAVLPEQAALAYNAQSPPIPLTALYVTPAPPALDYPFLVMPGADRATTRAITGLRAALTTASFRNSLAEQGLRGPDGVGGAGFTYPQGAPASVAGGSGAADLNAVDQTLSAWLALTQPGRILTAIDVSGSMLTKVPNAGNRTREQVTVEAATRGLELFDDSWALGLWTFSTNLDGDRDYREILPVGPLTATRERAVEGLAGIRPKVGGDTGLYDTILAAYREMLDSWDRGRLNTVVIMTDGDNDDDNGLTLQALLNELGKRKDPRRPVDIVIIGIGPDITQAPLQQITGVTGGGVFTAPDPADIGTIFLRALALHTQPK
jgi:Ca-activated chloride channel homolog